MKTVINIIKIVLAVTGIIAAFSVAENLQTISIKEMIYSMSYIISVFTIVYFINRVELKNK